MRASESSVAADPLRSRTASQSGAERRSSTDVRSMNACRSVVVGGEHLAREEVDDVGARAVERRDEAVLVRRAGERQRRQVDAGGPALGARDEQLDVGGVEPERQPSVEELVRLRGREPQLVRAQLQQLPARSQRAERQRRVGARREHDLHRGRDVLDEPRDAVARRAARQPMEVVEHEHDVALLGERVDEPRQHDLRAAARSGAAARAPGTRGPAPRSRATTARPRRCRPRPASATPPAAPRAAPRRRAASTCRTPPGRRPGSAACRGRRVSRANSRSRAIVCAGTCGACSFVTRRTGASGRLLISSTGTRSQRLPAVRSRRYGPRSTVTGGRSASAARASPCAGSRPRRPSSARAGAWPARARRTASARAAAARGPRGGRACRR